MLFRSDFNRSKPFGTNFVLNTHFTGTCFLPVLHTSSNFLGTQALRSRKLFTSAIILSFHSFPLLHSKVSVNIFGSPISDDTDVLCISATCSSCTLLGTLIGTGFTVPVTTTLPSRTGGFVSGSSLTLTSVGLYDVCSLRNSLLSFDSPYS